MNDIQVQQVLKRLYRIVEAGEKGFATSAVNMPHPGIKVLLKSFAQQRANFCAEIQAELRRLGGDSQPGRSIPGIIHRGRMVIFAGMSIERDRQVRVVLREAAIGERVALGEYNSALREDLPAEVSAMLKRQRDGIQQVIEQIALLRGTGGKQLNVGLYESERSAAQAVQALQSAGFAQQAIQTTNLREAQAYQERGATVAETAASGAFGGALWGGLTGILVGYGVVQSMYPAGTPIAAMLPTGLLAVVGFMVVGAIIATALGLFIGSSVSEGDKFQYGTILQHGDVLVLVESDEARAAEAAKILAGDSDPASIGAAKRAI